MTTIFPGKLPEQFAQFQTLAEEWCRPSQMERLDKRLESTIDEIRVFYDAATSHLQEIMAYLEKVELADMSSEDEALLQFSFAIAMITPAIELFDQPAVVCGFDARKFLPLHEATSDRPGMSIAPQTLV